MERGVYVDLRDLLGERDAQVQARLQRLAGVGAQVRTTPHSPVFTVMNGLRIRTRTRRTVATMPARLIRGFIGGEGWR
jgi:hypothetical protein